MESLTIRRYGNAGPFVILLHGGPGAPGYMAPVGRGLADSFRVLEPFQRASGKEPLSVARHVANLQEIVQSQCGGMRPAIVGHSWGAMLALAYAAGTFDTEARSRIRAIRESRMDNNLRERMEGLLETVPDPNDRLQAMAGLFLPLDSYKLFSTDLEIDACDARAFDETWQDMLRLQAESVYPAAFGAIKTRVLMLHGAADPHPGEMIRASLQPYVPQLEYRELAHCGHYPWLEMEARDAFFLFLRGWLSNHLREGTSGS